jgi:hypothetical protein
MEYQIEDSKRGRSSRLQSEIPNLRWKGWGLELFSKQGVGYRAASSVPGSYPESF